MIRPKFPEKLTSPQSQKPSVSAPVSDLGSESFALRQQLRKSKPRCTITRKKTAIQTGRNQAAFFGIAAHAQHGEVQVVIKKPPHNNPDAMRAFNAEVKAYRMIHRSGPSSSIDSGILKPLSRLRENARLVLPKCETTLDTAQQYLLHTAKNDFILYQKLIIHFLDFVQKALTTLYDHQCAHLDIKPSNTGLRRSKDGHIVGWCLFDLDAMKPFKGIAYAGEYAGTKNYTAPECIFPYGITDELADRADIYSMGMMLKYLLPKDSELIASLSMTDQRFLTETLALAEAMSKDEASERPDLNEVNRLINLLKADFNTAYSDSEIAQHYAALGTFMARASELQRISYMTEDDGGDKEWEPACLAPDDDEDLLIPMQGATSTKTETMTSDHIHILATCS